MLVQIIKKYLFPCLLFILLLFHFQQNILKVIEKDYYSNNGKLVYKQIITLYNGEVQETLTDFLQEEENTCGIAVLSYLVSLYGHPAPQSKLKKEMNIIKNQWVSFLDLKEYLLKNGYSAMGIVGSYEDLLKDCENNKNIVHFTFNHFGLILGIDLHHVFLFDPLCGIVKVGRNNFQKFWSGYYLKTGLLK